jgi:hypothetical protein
VQEIAQAGRGLPGPFFKFPRTRHVAALGAGIARGDILMAPDDARTFFSGVTVVTVEEVRAEEGGLNIITRSRGTKGVLSNRVSDLMATAIVCDDDKSTLRQLSTRGGAHRIGLEEGVGAS